MQIPSLIRRCAAVSAMMLAAGVGMVAPATGSAASPAAAYVPGKVVVGFRAGPTAAAEAAIAARGGARLDSSTEPGTAVLDISARESLASALARLRAQPDVAYAVPDYIAHASGFFIPNDRGRGPGATDWRALQWNFLSADGVGAPVAWSNLRHDQAPGGRGETVAILDTGVAYTNWTDPRTHMFFARSPDFAQTRFSHPCDLIRGGFAGGPNATITSKSRCKFSQAVDRNGHGTFVAGVVGESTNNRVGVTGLAYGATIMPVRVLDAAGDGDSVTIAHGIRYAVTHGARIINLSLEFDLSVTADQIPNVIDAINFAYHRGVMVVAAAGNDSANELAYPAADPQVVSVGATTRDRCVAAYSNTGPGLSLVAPGGGDDSAVTGGPNCHPGSSLPDVYQMTLLDPTHPSRFGLPAGWYGTSMAAPHVAAAAALVIASGVLGAHPTPAQVLARLENTASPLGSSPRPNQVYGYGLLNAAAATSGVSRTAHGHQPSKRPGKPGKPA
jgi:serine protease